MQQFARAESLAEQAQASTVDDRTDAEGEAAEGDWAAPLHVEARLGLAATLVAMGAWRHAAESYLAAAALARAIPDPRTEFESLRMAAAAYEAAGASEEAWTEGLAALKLAAALDEDVLEHSTAPWLGEQLMRACRRGSEHEHERGAIVRKLEIVLGSGWRRRTSVS